MAFNSSTYDSTASNYSDEINSVLSTFSGLSNYQDEYEELKHLTNPRTHSFVDQERSSTPKNDSGCDTHYEEHFDDISCQSQSALKVDQKYEDNSFLENDIEIKFHNKLEILLKNNRQLESELANAKDQIERLLKKFSTTTRKLPESDHYFIQLEQKNYNLTFQNSVLRKNLSRIEEEKCEVELQMKQLRIELNQKKIDSEMKNAVLKELKDKISHQHIEITKISRDYGTTSQILNKTKIELENAKKEQDWYKQQLYAAQGIKKNLLEDLSNCKLEIASQNRNISLLNIELEKMKNIYESSQLKSLREKDCFHKTLQEYHHLFISGQRFEESRNIEKTDDDSSIYKDKILDLENEISRIKTFVKLQEVNFKKISTENSDLLSRCITMQKSLEQKEFVINTLDIENKNFRMTLASLEDRHRKVTEKVNEMNKELINVKTELCVSQQENAAVENTVKTIRGQFTIFKLKYNKLKEELSNKNKQISCLQGEKQELFMRNNWQICELEKIQGRDTLIHELKREIDVKDQEIQRYSNEVEALRNDMEKQNISISDLNNEKEIIISEKRSEVQRYDNEAKANKLNKNVENETILTEYTENLDDDSKTLINIGLHKPALSVETDKKGTLGLTSGFQTSKQKLLEKLCNISIRIEKLNEKTLNCQKLLNGVFCAVQSKRTKYEGADDLRVLLQVKNLEIHEKQKRNEANNRTLLRKVKEHMKKRARYENDSLKLSIENYIITNRELKKSVSELGKRLGTCSPCDKKFVDNTDLWKSCEKIDVKSETEKFDMKLKSEECSSSIQMANMCVIEKLQKEVQDLCSENASLKRDSHEQNNKYMDIIAEKTNYLNLIEELKKKLMEKDSLMNKLNKSVDEEKLNASREYDKNIILEERVNELRDKLKFFSSENQILSFSLQKKTEELKCLEEEILEKQTTWKNSRNDSGEIISELKNHINDMQIEIQKANSEKFFLQRMCNDLKISLKSQSNYNKVLKEKLVCFSQKRQDAISIPILPDLMLSTKYDDAYINKLVQNVSTSNNIQLTEIRGSLGNLKQEIFSLQKEITKKNCF
ncbi:hypothetical protein JTB14_012430 [Gonioctena quinquepunctata]|nr:hypothetical protein JTB14_012430 [Gonioctena quinquepunctata]